MYYISYQSDVYTPYTQQHTDGIVRETLLIYLS